MKGETLRLIDEWQDAPVLWDAVRNAVDERRLKGQFILTGSTVIDDSDKEETQRRMHTGTGRISSMTMYPISLYESQESNGSVSLQQLFDDPGFDADGVISALPIEEIIFAVCRGRWLASLGVKNEKTKLFIAKDYVNVICEEDISKVDNVRRNPVLVRLILRSYARNLCTLVQKTKMLADITVEMETTSMTTFEEYIGALERLYVIEVMPGLRQSGWQQQSKAARNAVLSIRQLR